MAKHLHDHESTALDHDQQTTATADCNGNEPVCKLLTATDSLGLSRTISRRLVPRTVDVRFETGPINLKLDVNGYTFRAPEVFSSWEGYALNIAARRQRDGRVRVFDHWSDGPGAHTIKTPGGPKTYKAYFRRG
jgi:hypothetical protein